MASKSPLPSKSLGQSPLHLPSKCSLTKPNSLPYKTHVIDISKDTQKEPWFLAINPNGRIPALTDTFTDGQTIRLFESGSIMQYLVEQYDTDHKISYPKGSRESYEVNNWLYVHFGGPPSPLQQRVMNILQHDDTSSAEYR